MIHIGPIDLEKKAAVVAVVLENPLKTSKKAAEMGADVLEIRLQAGKKGGAVTMALCF